MTRDLDALQSEPVRTCIDWDHYRDMAVRERRMAIVRLPGRVRAVIARALTARQRHRD